MPGEGVTLMAIDQKANLGYRGKVGVERSDDGEQGKGFGLNARGVRLGKGSTEIDDCHLIGDGGCVLGVRDGHQEDFINAGYSAACTADAGDGVSGLGIVEGLEQSFKEDTGPGAIVVRQRKVEVFLDQRTVGIVGNKKRYGRWGSLDCLDKRGRALDDVQAILGAFAQADEDGGHGNGGDQHADEKSALRAGNHGCCLQSLRHSSMAAVRASSIDRWYAVSVSGLALVLAPAASGAISMATAGQAKLSMG